MAVRLKQSKNKNKYPHIKLLDQIGTSKHSQQRRKKNKTCEDTHSIVQRLRSQTTDVGMMGNNTWNSINELRSFYEKFHTFPIFYSKGKCIAALLHTPDCFDELLTRCPPSDLQIEEVLLKHDTFIITGSNNVNAYTINPWNLDLKRAFSRLEKEITEGNRVYYRETDTDNQSNGKRLTDVSMKMKHVSKEPVISLKKTNGSKTVTPTLPFKRRTKKVALRAYPLNSADFETGYYTQATNDDDSHTEYAISGGTASTFRRSADASSAQRNNSDTQMDSLPTYSKVNIPQFSYALYPYSSILSIYMYIRNEYIWLFPV